jgi:UDP-N-acetylmuramoyl-L-alanyl-D-glutamate--2,6-diaminopimelate ligase
MLFSELTSYLTGARVAKQGDAEITGITYDSREVKPGWLFVAMQGGSFDGHRFVGAAVEAGAVAVIAERDVDGVDVPCVIVADGRTAMGEISAPFFGFPSRKMKLVGVTGTSGKTTVTHLIQSIFNASGRPAGLIGTLGARIGDELIETKHTTPESVDLQRTLAYMADRGVKVVAIEASSHGLYQGRTLGCEFDCGVFTNIARDHLDFHGTLEAYLDAKLILFRDYPARSAKRFVAAINADDPAAGQVIDCAGGGITFAVENSADVKATNIEVTDRSVRFDMTYQGRTVPIGLAIGGFFNVYNALAASAAALGLGLDLDTIIGGLAVAHQVPGRFESVDCGQDFGVIVDYAHTPDELENVLRTAKSLASNRLIAMFGCGGDRDRGKRPIMGRIGTDLADLVVVTSDNPRTEDPEAIIAEVLTGIDEADRPRVTVQPDRREGIREAIAQARAGDVVVIAGKGHEDYQIFADRTIHFDDREVAREALQQCSQSRPKM